MAAKGSTYANDLLALIFNGTTITGLADNTATSPLLKLWLSLHTASPAGGNQSTSEAAYGSYARLGVNRNSGGFNVAAGSVSLAATASFNASTGSPNEVEAFFGIGTSSIGAGELLYYGAITPSITVNQAFITPQIAGGTAIVTES